jgi:hypothetical protein
MDIYTKLPKKTLNSGGFFEILLILLVIIAAVLGYFIYTKYNANQSPNTSIDVSNDETNSTATTSNISVDGDAEGEVPITPYIDPQADKKKQVLVFPPQDASSDAQQKHSDLVSELSVTSEVLDISSCDPVPVVLRVSPESKVKLTNYGATESTLYVGGKTFVVPADGSTEITISSDIGSTPGIYGYACNGRGLVGIFAVYNN